MGRKITTLTHEARDNTMEGRVLVTEPRLVRAQPAEILCEEWEEEQEEDMKNEKEKTDRHTDLQSWAPHQLVAAQVTHRETNKQQTSITILPAGLSLMVMSKKTLGFSARERLATGSLCS